MHKIFLIFFCLAFNFMPSIKAMELDQNILDDSLQSGVNAAASTQLPESPLCSPILSRTPPLTYKFKGHVLVVDDDKMMRTALSRILNSLGFTTDLASGGHEAIAAVKENQDKYSFVFTDIEMDPMDGYTEIRTIRQEIGNATLIIFAVTSCSSKDLKEKCTGCGANAIIMKPVTARTVCNAIDEIMKKQ